MSVATTPLADTTFLLLRAGHHPLREIQQTLRHLEHGGIEPSGVIFNDMPERQGYGSYHYQYKGSHTQSVPKGFTP